MTDPLQALLQAANLPVNNFPATSRYYRVETAIMKINDDKQVAFIRRRFIPAAETLTVMSIHQVKQSDRLDNIAANYIGDPEQFWQVADANNAMKPEELTDEPGTQLRITQPQNFPGI
jgi:hypothetical protein